MVPDFLTLADRRLAYQRQVGDPTRPGIVFLGGYASDMTGSKASFLSQHCARKNISFLRFDYRGHGQSGGDFKDGTIGSWAEDAEIVFDQLTTGPQIVIGSSMGGWIGLMLATKKLQRIKAFIGIAAAPDFTEDLMWSTFSPTQREQLKRAGFIYEDNAPRDERVPVTLKLIEEARQHLMLRGPINLQCPVRLLQGMEDRDVPWEHALRIAKAVAHPDVRVTFIKDGDHRLSREQDLHLLAETAATLID